MFMADTNENQEDLESFGSAGSVDGSMDFDDVELDDGCSSDLEQSTHILEGFEVVAQKVDKNEELLDEELDKVADLALGILRSMLTPFGFSNTEIDEYTGDNGELLFNITGDDLGILIGYHGKVLDSFKYMFTTALNHKLGFRFPAHVDVEGYEERQSKKIQGIARSAARRAVQQNSAVRLRPMKPFERRLVHLALRNNKDVVSRSEGSDPTRCVVIRPARH